MRVPVIQSHNFDVFYEYHDGLTWIHCNVFRYNKSVKKELEMGMRLLMALRDTPLMCLHELDDIKHKKFIKMLGFKYQQTNLCHDGTIRDIYKKEVN